MPDFKYRGKTLEELKEMDLEEFIQLLPSKQRRKIKRGFTDSQKKLLEKIEEARQNVDDFEEMDLIKTHCRNMPILPRMVGLKFGVYSGIEYVDVKVEPDMVGFTLGEFTKNRKRVDHSTPGVGATRGSTFVPIK